MTASLNFKRNLKTLKRSDIIETKTIICSSCDKELGEVMVLPGISSNKEGPNEYHIDTIKCICPCGDESFLFKFNGRIKFAPAFPIKEQYTSKNEIIVEYERNNSNR